MNTRLAEISRTMDAAELGRRIRNARIAAGMTQADIAGDDVSAAYVSRIEDGQRRPEFTLLGRMAARAGITLEDLLQDSIVGDKPELEVAVDHAELALAAGEPAVALDAADAAIAELLAAHGSHELVTRARSARAAALEATGDTISAIIELEDLTATPAASLQWLKNLIALSRCYRLEGDLDRAIAAGEAARESIEQLGLDGLGEAVHLSVTVAAAYLLKGDLDHALRLCTRAIETGESIGSPSAKASAYRDASLAQARRGESALALDLARKGLAYVEFGQDATAFARLRAQVAGMQLELDPPDPEAALAMIARAEADLARSPGNPIERVSRLHTKARAELLLGEFEQALITADEALRLTPEAASTSRASGHALKGQISMAAGDVATARRELLTAVEVLSSAGSDREAAQLWYELGGHLDEVGESTAALDAFRRAATSAGLRAPHSLTQQATPTRS